MAPGLGDRRPGRGARRQLRADARRARRVVEHGVTIIGWFNLASTVPYHASQMYARNLSAFLLHLVKDGKLQLNRDDEIIRDTLVTRGGEIVNTRVRDFFSPPAIPAHARGTEA